MLNKILFIVYLLNLVLYSFLTNWGAVCGWACALLLITQIMSRESDF